MSIKLEEVNERGLSMAVPPRQVHFTRLNQDKPFSSKGTVPALPGPGAVAGRPAARGGRQLASSPPSHRLGSRQTPSLQIHHPSFTTRCRRGAAAGPLRPRYELRWLATASNRCSGNDFVAGTMGRGLVAACASCVLARRGPRGRSMRTARARDFGWGACGRRLSLRRILSLVLQL